MNMTDVVEEVKSIEYDTRKRLAELGKTADRVVRRHPWKVAGAAAVLGVALSFLFRWRS